MMLELNRIAKKPLYTIGRLFVDRKYFCDTLEDCCRDLDKEEKVMNETAIPEGTYEVIVHVSAKFRRKLPYCWMVPTFPVSGSTGETRIKIRPDVFWLVKTSNREE